MAKKSVVERNKRRIKTVQKFAKRRAELKAIMQSSKSSPEEVDEARRKFERMPRNASPSRVTNRCHLTGRPRGYYRKFGLSRIALREKAVRGELPGVTKASW